MRILVVGAGATGGYLGARLAEAGTDVTFLVREKRKKRLSETQLKVSSVKGDVSIVPKMVVREEQSPFDVIFITSKAYSLDQVIHDIKPFTYSETLIVPFLNGFAHYEKLFKTFSQEQVLGGLCFIESTLNHEGHILHTSQAHRFVFGEWNGKRTNRIESLEKEFGGINAEIVSSNQIMKEVWHKYLFIAALSGITTLFKQPIGPILKLETGRNTTIQVIREIVSVMRAIQAPLSESIESDTFSQIQNMHEEMKSSMLRDMEKGSVIEDDHLHGYLIKKGAEHGLKVPVLETIYTNLKLYSINHNNIM
ncbi:ketopantoate reductase family protein [Bacillus gobiensis]|uniref:ketopantoate reductase family protein n=1 Tax=Bacillus gobiensis TaxID=1441095 RepID=UPI003D1F8AC9